MQGIKGKVAPYPHEQQRRPLPALRELRCGSVLTWAVRPQEPKPASGRTFHSPFPSHQPLERQRVPDNKATLATLATRPANPRADAHLTCLTLPYTAMPHRCQDLPAAGVKMPRMPIVRYDVLDGQKGMRLNEQSGVWELNPDKVERWDIDNT